MKSRLILVGVLLVIFAGAWFALLFVERSYPDHVDQDSFSLIDDGVYQGGSVKTPPPGTQAVLNLCEIQDQYSCEVHAWEAIPDRAPAPSIAWLEKMVKWVDANVRQ